MKSPLNYFGGKSRLAEKIIKRIPEHLCYCEPFSGAAWVLFTKPPSKQEVINDLDNELATFWRVLQNHLQPFLEYFKYAVISRKLFELENRKDPETLTDIQRAVRYYYLQRLCFGGLTSVRVFRTSALQPSNLNLTTVEETLLNVHWRLGRVTIEHLDAFKCIEKYDRPSTFFYVDPPYYHTAQNYTNAFIDEDFKRLASFLANLKGKFLLSLNDHPDIRSMFRKFSIQAVTTKYCSGNARASAATRSKERKELFICNFT